MVGVEGGGVRLPAIVRQSGHERARILLGLLTARFGFLRLLNNHTGLHQVVGTDQLHSADVSVRIKGRPVDVQVQVGPLALVDGEVVVPLLLPPHGLGVGQAVGHGDRLLVVAYVLISCRFLVVPSGQIFAGDGEAKFVQEGEEFGLACIVLWQMSLKIPLESLPVVNRYFFPLLVLIDPHLLNLIVDHRAVFVVLGQVVEVKFLVLCIQVFCFQENLLPGLGGIIVFIQNLRPTASSVVSFPVQDHRVAVRFAVSDIVGILLGVAGKMQLQVGGDLLTFRQCVNSLRQGLPEVFAVVPHLGGRQVDVAQPAVRHHINRLSGQLCFAVGGLVAVIVGFVLVHIIWIIPRISRLIARGSPLWVTNDIRLGGNLYPSYF